MLTTPQVMQAMTQTSQITDMPGSQQQLVHAAHACMHCNLGQIAQSPG
jgi:hypothetical protein